MNLRKEVTLNGVVRVVPGGFSIAYDGNNEKAPFLLCLRSPGACESVWMSGKMFYGFSVLMLEVDRILRGFQQKNENVEGLGYLVNLETIGLPTMGIQYDKKNPETPFVIHRLEERADGGLTVVECVSMSETMFYTCHYNPWMHNVSFAEYRSREVGGQ